jgi:hypothetical protein
MHRVGEHARMDLNVLGQIWHVEPITIEDAIRQVKQLRRVRLPRLAGLRRSREGTTATGRDDPSRCESLARSVRHRPT